MTNALKRHLKLLALKALPEIEQRAARWFQQHGEKLGGKRELALDYMEAQYTRATAAIPGLKDTSIDDLLMRQFSGEALDWAWELIGDQINALGRAPVNNDTSLPNGGLNSSP
jgi:hypothetical protein